MFIENINYQNFNKKINYLDKNINETKNKKSDNFIDCIKTALGEISNIQNHTKTETEKFLSNKSQVSLNDIVINLEKSSISMQMAIQIRNKIVSAYQEIMNQQI
ncbi:flagellar hook-basal body complex protein FliE [Buchnera aphidicola]|uniref:Flagellar hook-basal body complex protein FliE n=1 Tax=Buchnera aphidicola (Lipaphis pseudobrassicae) TaxID=1258543 RepID=A0A4D6Y6L4_9GAMM|nr:flagellar hook-basal body complex protein FliE [Buchnera aphidicola]QCI21964.1 flagellar hook-basal body complex protein FliE [Buchnera aphidicola (Lipaphis pseudobrassicae)]